MPSVVTANLLGSGDVVYLAVGGRWARHLADAEVASSKPDLARLEGLAGQAAELRLVTAVYAMDVSVVAGRPTPLPVRERIRAAHGPTV